ncbi:hypothetical protein KSP40_PGU009005 [Platanthera guangdongensis]|uniref:DUF4378 domain-containing protein n=1 Tax=Platanthera guangdongensis TaxID=2320717 RepID=A0ABR2MC60_9ASPA
MEDRSNSTVNRGTGRNWMLNFIPKKLLKRNNHTGKISRSFSRMQRTISIHHLECTDYVPQSEVGQMATKIQSLKIALNFDSSVISEHELMALKENRESVNRMLDEACSGIDAVDDFSGSHYNLDEMPNKFLDEHIALKRKLLEARDTLSRKENTKPKGMENEFAIQSKLLDRLELFIANRETLLDNSEGPDYISPDLVEILESPTEIKMLRKSASCPEFLVNSADILFPRHKSMQRVSFVNQGTKFETSSFINTKGVSFCSEGVHGSHELRKQREAGSVLNQLRGFKQRMNDVIIIENRKDKHRILRDGILHKVPFGHKLPDDVEDKKLNLRNDPSSEKCDGGGEGSKSNAARDFYRKWAHKSFQRSCLSVESLDNYPQLFGSLLLDEKRKVPERSKSVREDNCLPRFPKNLGRMLSSPELRSYSFNKDVLSDVYQETTESIIPEHHGKERKRFVRSKSIHEDTDFQEGNLSKNFGRMLSSPLLRSYSFNKVLQSSGYLELTKTVTPEPLGNCMKKPILEKNDCEHEVVVEPDILSTVEDTVNSDKFVTPTVESFIEMVDSRVNPVSVESCTHIEPSFITEVMEEEPDSDCMPATGRKDECDVKSGSPSFSSFLDISLLEGSASSAKDLRTKESELQPMRTVSAEQQHQPSDSPSNVDCNHKQMASEASSFRIHIDREDENVFEFVRHISTKLRYRILHQKTEFASHELGDEFHDAPFEQQLLYDLINEVFREIYANSPTPNLCLRRFRSKIRSMPEGNYLLKDVWDKIRRHLHSPLGLDATIDDLMAHTFAKNDGWLNLYCDAERVALQLELLILDDLLEESTVHSNRFAF